MAKISRRDTIRYITLAGISAGLLSQCSTDDKQGHGEHHHESHDGFVNLSDADKKLLQQKFFTDEERETVRVLANLIIPADDRSGNAEAAGCVAFIEFMMLDQADLPYRPDIQTPMRGGLAWLNNECLRRYNKNFTACIESEQKAVLDDIAYPDTADPKFSQGVAFFNSFRDMVASGFWSSKMGIEDLQYMGNQPFAWDGPPQEWLDRLGV